MSLAMEAVDATVREYRRAGLVDQAVIEAARRYVAAHLLVERAAGQGDEAEAARVFDRDDALQVLRDALASQSKVRVRR